MPQRDYKAYAKTERGKAARARAHAKSTAKRKTERAMKVVAAPLLQAISNWKPS